jgi:hypothetical protein
MSFTNYEINGNPCTKEEYDRHIRQIAPTCVKCWNKSELRSFNTFEYYYCPKCKVEVGGKAKPKAEKAIQPRTGDKTIPTALPASWQGFSAQAPLQQGVPVPPPPTGIWGQASNQGGPVPPLAHKGDRVLCASCLAHRATLVEDLTSDQSDSVRLIAINITSLSCCPANNWIIRDYSRYTSKYFVEYAPNDVRSFGLVGHWV